MRRVTRRQHWRWTNVWPGLSREFVVEGDGVDGGCPLPIIRKMMARWREGCMALSSPTATGACRPFETRGQHTTLYISLILGYEIIHKGSEKERENNRGREKITLLTLMHGPYYMIDIMFLTISQYGPSALLCILSFYCIMTIGPTTSDKFIFSSRLFFCSDQRHFDFSLHVRIL